MEPKKRRRYDQQFKEEAARLVTEQHQSCGAVERALGLANGLVKDWVRAYRKDPAAAFPGNGRRRPNQNEIEKLKQENDLLRKQRDILKKALAIFSMEPLRYMVS
jgi:transposase